jgi:hypothetical protein
VLSSGDGCDLVDVIAERGGMPHLACDQTANIIKALADCGGTLSALASTFLLDELPGTTLECDQNSFVRLLPERECEATLKVVNRQVLGVTSTSTITSTTRTTTTFINISDPNYVPPAQSRNNGADGHHPLLPLTLGVVAAAAAACW